MIYTLGCVLCPRKQYFTTVFMYMQEATQNYQRYQGQLKQVTKPNWDRGYNFSLHCALQRTEPLLYDLAAHTCKKKKHDLLSTIIWSGSQTQGIYTHTIPNSQVIHRPLDNSTGYDDVMWSKLMLTHATACCRGATSLSWGS